MRKSTHLLIFTIAVAIGATWGYFVDLSAGRIGMFVLRLAISAGVGMLVASLWGRHSKEQR